MTAKRRMTWLRYAAVVLFFISVFYVFAYRGTRFFLVPSQSMEPTLLPRDYLVTQKERQYQRGDIVVLHDPTTANDSHNYLVKRIVAVAGDKVAIRGGALFINGLYASEPYIIKEPISADVEVGPLPVADGQVFILGDNRNLSEDSSTWKRTLPTDGIVGKVRFIYHPFERMGPVRSFPLTNSAGQ